MAVVQRDATVTGEAVGEVIAFRSVELRPQVTGTVRSIHFDPGQRVQEGELLFVIDPRPYEASLAKEQAALADAQATLARARQDVERYKPLLPENAIPRATYDAAVAEAKSAEAAVRQRQAAIRQLRLDVQNTEVRSPVTGQIGIQQVEVGGLASAQQTVLATVSTVDPVYVEFSVPEADYVRYVRGAEKRKAAGGSAAANPVTLTLPDGSEYPHPGKVVFAERAISGATGTLGVRAQFENPKRLLRTGLNVRVRLVYDQVPDAVLVPQRAVTELLGRQFVSVVGGDNRAEQRPVELGERVDGMWIVGSGLKPGERVIVDGTQKAPPGSVVAPTLVEQ
jgi:membrane fusion protein (multidrug efflux system)